MEVSRSSSIMARFSFLSSLEKFFSNLNCSARFASLALGFNFVSFKRNFPLELPEVVAGGRNYLQSETFRLLKEEFSDLNFEECEKNKQTKSEGLLTPWQRDESPWRELSLHAAEEEKRKIHRVTELTNCSVENAICCYAS